MNNINLCPFCGGKSRVHKYLGKWYARCNKCKAYSAPYDTEEQAAEALHETDYLMDNPSRLHHRFDPIDLISVIKEKYGIDLEKEFPVRVEVQK